MAVRRKRHKRSPHPGVVLHLRHLPSGRTVWRARFWDPDNPTGKPTELTLDPVALPTHEARREWAIRKSKALASRRMELELGAPLRTRTPLLDAIDDYLQARSTQVKPSTLVADRKACARFRPWVELNGPRYVEELSPAHLLAYRESRIAAPLQSQARGKRGARRVVAGRRKPASINHELRPILALLNHWRRMRVLPGVTRDELGEALKPLRAPATRPAHLNEPEARRLLEAALRHDADCFKLTAAEHRGQGAPGQTPRYQPIAPFVAFMLLSGCRVGEALGLRWQDVDLDARDNRGHRAGEIRLPASATKTSAHRTIALEVAPGLRLLLAVMKLRSAGNRFVFGGNAPLPRTRIEAARKRLIGKFGAAAFTWQNLRQPTGTYLTNAPAIFGAGAAWRSSRQLGHSVGVAEKHYLGLVRGISPEARTLEAALGIEAHLEQVVAQAEGRGSHASDSAAVREIGA